MSDELTKFLSALVAWNVRIAKVEVSKEETQEHEDADDGEAPKWVTGPASADDARQLLNERARYKPQVGDRVRWRLDVPEWVQKLYRWPAKDHECIVSHVMDTPLIYSANDGAPVEIQDMLLVFKSTRGSEERIFEHAHSSSQFEKIGSIFN